MPDRFERFSFAILEIWHHWHTIASAELAPLGLKIPHALILLTMQSYEEGITAAQLSELCGRDKSEVSRSIALLEKKGLILRDEVNRGSYRARLRFTREGRQIAARLRARARIAVECGGRGIGEAQRNLFYETLELIAYNLQTLSLDGLPPTEEHE